MTPTLTTTSLNTGPSLKTEGVHHIFQTGLNLLFPPFGCFKFNRGCFKFSRQLIHFVYQRHQQIRDMITKLRFSPFKIIAFLNANKNMSRLDPKKIDNNQHSIPNQAGLTANWHFLILATTNPAQPIQPLQIIKLKHRSCTAYTATKNPWLFN